MSKPITEALAALQHVIVTNGEEPTTPEEYDAAGAALCAITTALAPLLAKERASERIGIIFDRVVAGSLRCGPTDVFTFEDPQGRPLQLKAGDVLDVSYVLGAGRDGGLVKQVRP